MGSLRCHGDSDCNKTQIVRNFHLYVIQLWKPFFHIFTHGDVINAQTWEVSPPQKIQSSHLKHCLKYDERASNINRIAYSKLNRTVIKHSDWLEMRIDFMWNSVQFA